MRKRLLQLAVLALILFLAVQIAYRWMESKVNAVLGPGAGMPAEQAGREGDGDSHPLLTHEAASRMILARNIFKAAEEGLSGAALDPRLDELLAGNGPLELLGTVTGDDASARAIIRRSAQEREKIYRLGDEVEGAKIVRIERGRVALATANGPELLLLKERANEQALPSPTEAQTLPGDNPLLVPLQSPAVSGRSVPQALPGRRINTVQPSTPKAEDDAAGVPIRTGAAALRPLDAPDEQPTQPDGADAPEP